MKYSVLMSVYKKENPIFLRAAIDSILSQTVQTDDFIIVWDGPLSDELKQVLEDYDRDYPGIFRFLKLEQNMGLGHALNLGVLHCKHSLIARMDSDDVAVPERIAWQLAAFKKSPQLALCGGQIHEFVTNSEMVENTRVVPCTYKAICTYAKKRNPMNHMTVMFKKQMVLEAGNYLPMDFAEDYYLWVRMLSKGYFAINLPEVLVKARVGNGMFQRRGGLNYAKNIGRLMLFFRRSGFINRREFICNIIARSIISLLPTKVRKRIYQNRLRK